MRSILFFILLISSTLAHAQRAVPPLWGHRVHDEASVLSGEVIDELEVKLKLHEDSTSNQIAILIIPSLDGDDLESYSLRVAEEWKLGTAKNDNGILLLVAVNDHKMRIEVGHGLEGVVPDAIASRIIRNEMAPYFRESNYNDGVKAGINAIIKAIGNEYAVSDNTEPTRELTLEEKLIGGAVIYFMLAIFTTVGLIVPGCAGWGLYAFLIPFYAAFSLVIFDTTGGLAVLGFYLIGFPIGKSMIKKTTWGKKLDDRSKRFKWYRSGKSGRSNDSGGFFSGLSSIDWSSSSSSSSFSGGGGSFGGGGSSGSW